MQNVSTQHEKIIQQFKYLLPLDPKQIKEELLQVLNRVYPFTRYPTNTIPPIELFEVEQAEKVITNDLNKELKSYCFIVLRGSLIVSRDSYSFTQEKYINDDNIREKAVYNFDQGLSQMHAKQTTVYLKIHNIWVSMAKKKVEQQERQFIRKKLMSIQFFSLLSFQEFDDCCKKAFIKVLGPEQILLEQHRKPYHMYVVTQGELCLDKRVKFTKEESLWRQVKSELKKNNGYCEQLFEFLVREPSSMDKYFEVDFILREIHQGEIICAKQTLCESPLEFTIRSTLKTKLICIKYPDLYVLNEDRLMEIRNWKPLCQIDRKKLRKQYYQLTNWEDFKEHLRKQQQLSKVDKMSFDQFLRKNVNLTQYRSEFTSNRVGQGRYVQSPAGKVLKMKGIITNSQGDSLSGQKSK